MREQYEKWKTFFWVHERKVTIFALVSGFIFDSLTASRPDEWFSNFVIVSYFLLAAGCIAVISNRGKDAFVGPLPLLPVLQFSFGNLASNLLVFYGRSGTLVGSGIFVGSLVAFLVVNEFLRKRYARTNMQIATWFLLFLPYAAMVTPVVLKQFGAWVFLLSGAVAAAVVAGLLALVFKVGLPEVRARLIWALLPLSIIYSVFTGMYFTNMLPPVPLSLTHIGIYHELERTPANDYAVRFEDAPWYEWWHDTNTVYHHQVGNPAHCFSAVFAPSGLSTPIFHRWEQKDADGSWRTVTYLSFPIYGGRDGGYRGYSQTYRLTEGQWRCSVETERGALIGQTNFTVVAGQPGALSEDVL